MDSEHYLEPDFDPATLKVAELRGVLLKHDVHYPSNAKKADLVDLFNTHLAPQAATLRTATRAVKPSSRAITNVADPEETPRRRTVSGRKSKTPARVSDAELWGDTPKTQSVRGTRRSSARPSVLPPSRPQDEADDVAGADTPFSSYNPFQQGSSPVAPVSAVKSVRKSLPAYEAKRRSTSGRKSDLGPGAGAGAGAGSGGVSSYADERYDGGTVKRRKQTQTPAIPAYEDRIVVKNEEEETDGYGMEAGEEFVPEEAAELVETPRQDVITHTRRPTSGSSRAGTGALSMIVSFLLLAYGLWWRREKIEAGYCGVGGLDAAERDSNTFADLVRPECEPCPPHAICYPGMDLECERDFIKVDKLVSFGGLVPVSPECVPDTEKERRKAIMSNAALEILRENGAEQRCKERFLNSDMPIEGVSEEDLRQVLYDRKAASLSDREFSELWRLALEDVTSREEVIVETDDNGLNKLQSTSLTALPLGCQIRFLVAGSLARHRVPLAGITSLILAILYLRASFASSRTLNEQVTKLVHISLRYLALHAEKHPENPAVAVAHLRDQVLRAEFNPQKRRKLWEGVERVVEQNSNVRAGEREIQGEIMRAWTWIGGRFVIGGGGGGENTLRLKEEKEEEEEAAAQEWDGKMRPIL